MNNYSRSDKSKRKNPMNKAIIDYMVRVLIDEGIESVRRIDILEETDSISYAEHIDWPFILKVLEIEMHLDLINVTDAFFVDEDKNPDGIWRFIPGNGPGFSTAGYAKVTACGGLLAVESAKRQKKIKDGQDRTLMEKGKTIVKRGILSRPQWKMLINESK